MYLIVLTSVEVMLRLMNVAYVEDQELYILNVIVKDTFSIVNKLVVVLQ